MSHITDCLWIRRPSGCPDTETSQRFCETRRRLRQEKKHTNRCHAVISMLFVEHALETEEDDGSVTPAGVVGESLLLTSQPAANQARSEQN